MKSFKTRTACGFTLVELLVVIAIIGVLAGIVLVSLNTARAKGRDGRRIADVRQIQTALELYLNDQSSYPSGSATVLDGEHLCSPGGWAASCGAGETDLISTTAAPTPAESNCTSTNSYTYAQTGSGAGYTLTFCLGGPTGGIIAGTHTATQQGIQ